MKISNDTLVAEINHSKILVVVPRGVYRLNLPQQLADSLQRKPKNGLALADRSAPPVHANYLAIGYAAVIQNKLVGYTWSFDLKFRDDPARADIRETICRRSG